jgi:hypothetical protein
VNQKYIRHSQHRLKPKGELSFHSISEKKPGIELNPNLWLNLNAKWTKTHLEELSLQALNMGWSIC